MTFDWRTFRERHPRLMAMIVLGKKLRTKVGILAVAACVADGIILYEPPFDLDRPNGWVLLGFLLIGAGIALRIAAHGYLKKKETLATAGVYSLCRHPLYLGSMLMTYGFCCLLNDLANWIVATCYFLIFYTLTIVWEEVRLAERYGDEHRRYRERTPLILPLGRIRRDGFAWRLAMRNGGGLLIGITALLLVAVAVMAEIMRPR